MDSCSLLSSDPEQECLLCQLLRQLPLVGEGSYAKESDEAQITQR